MRIVTYASLTAVVLSASLLVSTGCASLLLPAVVEETGQAPAAESVIERSLNNTPPVANAGSDQTVSAGQKVILNGTGSGDADGDALIFFWRQSAGDTTVELLGSFSAVPTFLAPADLSAATTVTFRLEVSDGFSFTADDISVTIQAAP